MKSTTRTSLNINQHQQPPIYNTTAGQEHPAAAELRKAPTRQQQSKAGFPTGPGMAPRSGSAELLAEAPAKCGRIRANEAGAPCQLGRSACTQCRASCLLQDKDRTPQVEEGCLDACFHFLAHFLIDVFCFYWFLIAGHHSTQSKLQKLSPPLLWYHSQNLQNSPQDLAPGSDPPFLPFTTRCSRSSMLST